MKPAEKPKQQVNIYLVLNPVHRYFIILSCEINFNNVIN